MTAHVASSPPRDVFRFVAEPGDDTRYEITVVRRHGGGWLVLLWDGRLSAKVYGLGTDRVDLEPAAGRWNKHTCETVARILAASFEADPVGGDVRRVTP